MLQHRKFGVFSILVALMLTGTFAVFSGCNGRGKSTSAGIIESDAFFINNKSGLLLLERQALDAPDNPYSTQYKAWDLWIAEHLVSAGEKTDSPLEPGTKKVPVSFAVGGWQVPILEQRRLLEEDIKHGTNVLSNTEIGFCYAIGSDDAVLWDACENDLVKLIASYYPPVPEWLAQAPPKAVQLLPDGQVVCFGSLGSGHDIIQEASEKRTGCVGCGPGITSYWQETQYLYEASGAMIKESSAALAPDVNRIMQYPMKESGLDFKNRLDGYGYFAKPGTDIPVAVFDYDGSYLGKTLPAYRDGHFFQPIAANYLVAIYAAQIVRSGK